MSGTVSHLNAVTDRDREFFQLHPRRNHRMRAASVEEVEAMPPHGVAVTEQPYSAVLRRVRGGLQKLIVPEIVAANLPEAKAEKVWRYWIALSP